MAILLEDDTKLNFIRLNNLYEFEILYITHKENYIAEHSKLIRFGNIGIVIIALTSNTPTTTDGFIEIGEIPYQLLGPVEIIEDGLNIQIHSNKILMRSISTENYFAWRRIISLPVILKI